MKLTKKYLIKIIREEVDNINTTNLTEYLGDDGNEGLAGPTDAPEADADASPGSKTISKMDRKLSAEILDIIKSKGATPLNQRLNQVDKQSERYAVAIMVLRDLLNVDDTFIAPFDNQLWQALGKVKGRGGFE